MAIKKYSEVAEDSLFLNREGRMPHKIGIDVGGTFTDFLLVDDNGNSEIYKVLSTPEDSSIGVFNGLLEMAKGQVLSISEFLKNYG